MEKYGFVYIWYDRKHKRYYIGCRWGNENDGYICSSTWMKNSYNRRPQDFKRRILVSNISNRKDLLEQEYNWLQKIRDEDIGTRYYNLSKRHFGHWSIDHNRRQSVGEKISAANKGNMTAWNKGKHWSDEAKHKMSIAKLNKPSPRKGVILSEETKRKVSESKKGQRIGITHSDEAKKKMSLAHKGKVFSDEHRYNMSLAKQGTKPNRTYIMTEEHKRKISDTLKRNHFLTMTR